MVQQQYTTERRKGKHLTLVEKGQIEAFFKIGISKSDIAKKIGVSRRTIQREIARGWVEGLLTSELETYGTYCAETSHNKYQKKQKAKQGHLKIGKNHELANYLDNAMKEDKKSPYAALEGAKKAGLEISISLRTLYHYIHGGILFHTEAKDMIYKKKRKQKVSKEKSIRKKGGKSIEQRAQSILNREEVGHLEMDTVVGKQGSSSCLLVFTDRKTRFQWIRKLPRKTSACVVETVKALLLEYPEAIKTITSDNGSEFMDAQSIERLGIEYFYAHSYCSYERGSNEANNKFIRRHISKGEDIGTFNEEEIAKIERWMNEYPRKLFNGKSAAEVYQEEFTKYFS